MTVRTLNRVLSAAIVRLEDDLLASVVPEETRRTASAIATVAGVYLKAADVGTFEERLEALRVEVAEVREEMDAERASAQRAAGAGAGTAAPDVN